MDRAAYQLMAAQERDHWWYRGRREFIAAALARVAPPAGARILDAGCGTGGNLQLLQRFGTVHGFEYDAGARELARQLSVGPVEAGALPADIPFAGMEFNVIGLFDVLEHIDDSVGTLRALGRRLTPDGAIVLTVPACPWLWGPHDEYHHHMRRYTRHSLQREADAAGLRVEYASAMNTLLFPLAIAQRLKERVLGYRGDAMPGRSMNELLYRTWRVERAWIPARTAPFGLSLLAILRRGAGRG